MGSFHVSVERTLVVLQAVALCCLLTAAVLRAVDAVQTGDGLTVAITWLALVPIITVLWVLRPRVVRAGHGVEWTMLAVLLATPIAVFGTLGFTIPVLLLVVAFAVVDVSLRAGVHATIWISCVGFALHLFGSLTSWNAVLAGATRGLINVVPVAVLLCFGIALGLSLRSFEKRRHDDQKVIDRLRHATEMEKELLLSDERARSARELHDGLGHRLTLVSMSLELAERMRGTDADQAWEEIRTAKDTTSDALAEMRMWVRALNPVRDAGARGLAALELIAESFRGTGLTVDVSGDEALDRELASDDEVALLIYRAVQEGLTNALRHSRARAVRILLNVKDHRIELSIVNDLGRAAAADLREPEPTFGFGLRGICDRAAEHGGVMHARRIDGEFHLDVVVPLGGSGVANREEST
ncbi:sensor histidine kinase [Brevibacterium luteolum]|uniref:sensor histidine kinase n=1 Tax=Brevibacterium luteolum TaxID=199591 RepID=UPI001C231E9B|nr:sensor histidine kinase [Brevibacterium luteolum]MBU8579773.1 sensor histidine kinase [Brevibacterium luteolum]